MRSRWILTLAAMTALLYAATAHAQPPTWSIERAALGIHAAGIIVDTEGESPVFSSFVPGVALSYSATSQMSLVGLYERDLANKLSIGKAGVRFRVSGGGNGDVYLGANLVGYGDEGVEKYGIVKATSWSASLNGSYPVMWAKNGATLLWGIASGEYDPENHLFTARLGMRCQLIGGKP